MLFHTFEDQQQRRAYGGSAFVEIQFCRLPSGTPIEKIVAVDSIKDFEDGSLYVDDENEFCRTYGDILDCGIYNNLKSGAVDPYGINYYTPEAVDLIVERLEAKKPEGYEAFLEWLEKAKACNGFYVLGI